MAMVDMRSKRTPGCGRVAYYFGDSRASTKFWLTPGFSAPDSVLATFASSGTFQSACLEAVVLLKSDFDMKKVIITYVVVAGAWIWVGVGHAAEACTEVTRSNLVRCVLAASLDVRANQAAAEAMRGRQDAVSAWLPSNPVVSFSAARRDGPAAQDNVTNWYVTLAQELQIAGQQALRGDAVGHEVRAQQHRTVAVQRDIAAAAWRVYFEALAAEEGLALARTLESIQRQTSQVAQARAREGLNAQVDADLAKAAAAKATQIRLEAERARHLALAVLQLFLGRNPLVGKVVVKGSMGPLLVADKLARKAAFGSAAEQPEVLAWAEEQRAYEVHAESHRRARVPNPTVSLFLQEDGFDEQVMGLGLSLPITLPHPVGQSYKGQADEAMARSKQSELQAKKAQQGIRLELATALSEYQIRQRQAATQSKASVQQAAQTLASLAEELRMGRIPPREALILQRGLTEYLLNDVSNRLAVALASVRLARAAGLPLERGLQ